MYQQITAISTASQILSSLSTALSTDLQQLFTNKMSLLVKVGDSLTYSTDNLDTFLGVVDLSSLGVTNSSSATTTS